MPDAPTTAPATSRRTLAKGAAWAGPAIVLTTNTLAVAASPLHYSVQVLRGSQQVADLNGLCDTKNKNSETNTSLTGQNVVILTIKVTLNGAPASGVAVTVVGDSVKDGEGNYMIGFSPTSQTTGFGESSTKRTAAVVTNASGVASVKVSTATYSSVDCGHIPRSGSFTVTVGTVQVAVPYSVTDCAATVACP